MTAALKNSDIFQENLDCAVVTVMGLKPWSPDFYCFFMRTDKLYQLSFHFCNPHQKKKCFLPWNVWGWVQLSKLRCPLTVRLTSRLLEVIDWVVLGPPRALSAALEVRGHLLCKSASFCTVATPVSHHQRPPPRPSSSFLPPLPPPSGLHPGKMGEASIKPFSLLRLASLRLLKLLANSFSLNAKRRSGPSCRAVKKRVC